MRQQSYSLFFLPILSLFILGAVSPDKKLETIRALDGAEFVSVSRFVIGKNGLTLSEATYIAADEIYIDGPVKLSNFSLTLEARRLVLSSRARFYSFEEAEQAPEGLASTTVAEGGKAGEDGHCKEYGTGEFETAYREKKDPETGETIYEDRIGGGSDEHSHKVPVMEPYAKEIMTHRGEDGKEGKSGDSLGNSAAAGDRGKNSGDLLIFAAEIEGEIRGSLNGQTGGKGGKGHKGGKGGNGGKGQNGKASTLTFGGRDACKGGNGGNGGLGGTGGKGGQGGNGGNILIVSPNPDEELSIDLRAGTGGAGGQGGDMGDPGTGGAGGNKPGGFLPIDDAGGDNSKGKDGIGFGDDDAVNFQGAQGSLGQPGNVGHTDLVEIIELESFFKAARLAWINYHLERSFWALTEKTFELIDSRLVESKINAMFSSEWRSPELEKLSEITLLDPAVLSSLISSWVRYRALWMDYRTKLEAQENEGPSLTERELSFLIESTDLVINSLNSILSTNADDSSWNDVYENLESLAILRTARMTRHLDDVSEFCGNFLKATADYVTGSGSKYKKAKGEILNRHFSIPACLESETFFENPMHPIQIGEFIEPVIQPETAGAALETQEVELYSETFKNPFATLWQRLLNSVLSPVFAFTEPHADEFSLETVWKLRTGKVISVKHYVAPIEKPTSYQRSGFLTNLHPLALDEVTKPAELDQMIILNHFSRREWLKHSEGEK